MKNADTDTLVDAAIASRIAGKKKRLESMRPLPNDVLERLMEDVQVRHTYHSNAIEGNTLSLQETKLVLEDGITISGKSLREHLEAVNNAKGFHLMEKLARGKRPIDHVAIQEVHETITRGILEDAGKYRTRNVRITGTPKAPPNYSKIPKLLDQLLDSLKDSGKSAIERAACLHHGLVAIHPFIDGNGRVSRLLTNLYLIRSGYPPIVLRKEDRKRYYRYLRDADMGNPIPFANFIAKAVDESLSYHLSAIQEDSLLAGIP
jgi:Fic family protein